MTEHITVDQADDESENQALLRIMKVLVDKYGPCTCNTCGKAIDPHAGETDCSVCGPDIVANES